MHQLMDCNLMFCNATIITLLDFWEADSPFCESQTNECERFSKEGQEIYGDSGPRCHNLGQCGRFFS